MMDNLPNNADRASWAEDAVNSFAMETYCGRDFTTTVVEQPDERGDAFTMIQDLIANLLHLAAAQGWDTDKIIENAVACFRDEVAEEKEQADAISE